MSLAVGTRVHVGVIFDLDGVIADNLHVMRSAFITAFHRCGGRGAPPFAEYRRHLGRGIAEILGIMQLPPEMEQVFVAESLRLTPSIRAYPGIPEVLGELRRRAVPIAVATGKSHRRAEHLLDHLGLGCAVNAVVGSDDVAAGKPAPDCALAAAGALALAPQRCVMVGDAVNDLEAGRAAGCAVAAALWGHGDGEELQAFRPDHVLAAPLDIAGLPLAAMAAR